MASGSAILCMWGLGALCSALGVQVWVQSAVLALALPTHKSLIAAQVREPV